MKTKLVSFYVDVDGTDYYSRCAERLKKQCQSLNIPHDIRQYRSTGNWLKNCNLKPTFILEMFNELQYPFFWFDVDCEITKELSFIDNCNCDISSVAFRGKSLIEPPLLVMDIIHYFNYNSIVADFLTEWKRKCDASVSQSIGDHRLFSATLREFLNNPKFHFQYLPPNYAYGPDVKLGLAKEIPSRKVAMDKVHKEHVKI